MDLSKATLKDLVEDFVRLQLGFGDKEFAVNNELGPLYDPEETENLPKKLSELGIKADTFLTVIDEDDDEPFVNVVINIEEAYVNWNLPPPIAPLFLRYLTSKASC